jgi:hypothetical protein
VPAYNADGNGVQAQFRRSRIFDESAPKKILIEPKSALVRHRPSSARSWRASYSTPCSICRVSSVKEVVISRQVVEGTAPALYIYADRPDRTGDAGASA